MHSSLNVKFVKEYFEIITFFDFLSIVAHGECQTIILGNTL